MSVCAKKCLEEERDKRHQQSVKRFLEADIIEEAEDLLKKLEEKYT